LCPTREHVEVPDHGRKDVVQIVCDAASELANGFHLLCLRQSLARPFQFFPCLDVFGHIAGHLDEPNETPVCLKERVDHDVRPEVAAILAHTKLLPLVFPFAQSGLKRLPRLPALAVFRRVEAIEVATDDLLSLVALDARGPGVPRHHHTHRVQHIDRMVGDVLDQRSIPIRLNWSLRVELAQLVVGGGQGSLPSNYGEQGNVRSPDLIPQLMLPEGHLDCAA
jgi:hypothetical protein